MYRDHKVVVWIPYGRELTVSVLLPYLLRDHKAGIIDDIWFCMNTDPGEEQEDDRKYAAKVARDHPEVTIKPCPGPDHIVKGMKPEWAVEYEEVKQRNTGRFPIYMQDRHTVYIRFDDDIVWVHPNTVITMVDRVLDRRADTIACFSFIWNNAVSSYLAQQRGRIPITWGTVGRGAKTSEEVSAVDPVGWSDPYFAEKLHKMVLDHLEAGDEDGLLLPAELTIGPRQQSSVSCFAIHGDEYADLKGILTWDEEEHWLTMHRPGEVNKRNIICGMAQVAHFSFLFQRDYLLKTDLLNRYRALSEKVMASL